MLGPGIPFEHPLDGSQFNQPAPYGRRSTDVPLHPVAKAHQRYQRLATLHSLAKGSSSTNAQMEEHSPAIEHTGPIQDPAIEQLRNKITHIEGRLRSR